MIRVIVRTQDVGDAIQANGRPEFAYRTFDIECPELEAYLREPRQKQWTYTTRSVVGAELKPEEQQ